MAVKNIEWPERRAGTVAAAYMVLTWRPSVKGARLGASLNYLIIRAFLARPTRFELVTSAFGERWFMFPLVSACSRKPHRIDVYVALRFDLCQLM